MVQPRTFHRMPIRVTTSIPCFHSFESVLYNPAERYVFKV